MKIFRAEIHGHIVEARQGDLGGETILVDGRIVSHHRFAGWLPAGSHFFDLTDESGKPRHVELRWIDRSGGLGLGAHVRITVDGADRGKLTPVSLKAEPGRCLNCGYDLAGLPVDNGEVRCPECGRHTSAATAGLARPRD